MGEVKDDEHQMCFTEEGRGGGEIGTTDGSDDVGSQLTELQTKKQHGNETRACDQRQERDDVPTLGVLNRFQNQRVCNVRRSRSGWAGKLHLDLRIWVIMRPRVAEANNGRSQYLRRRTCQRLSDCETTDGGGMVLSSQVRATKVM